MIPALHYTHSPLARSDHLRSDTEALAYHWHSATCRIVPLFHDQHLVTAQQVGQIQTPLFPLRSELEPFIQQAAERVFLGIYDEAAWFAVDIDKIHESTTRGYHSGDAEWAGLWQFSCGLVVAETALLGYARAMIHWRKQTHFCSVCGDALTAQHGGHVLRSRCGKLFFPRTDAAVIALVERRDPLTDEPLCLLGRNARWPTGVYSTLAGFVEPGETLEEAVQREVMEEAGIQVGTLRYMASQPWPFPSSLMLGFIAKAESVDIICNSQELEDAKWFSRQELLMFGEWGDEHASYRLPRLDSIARFLIQSWLVATA